MGRRGAWVGGGGFGEGEKRKSGGDLNAMDFFSFLFLANRKG